MPELATYSAQALLVPGGLVMTVFGLHVPTVELDAVPLLTFGVARCALGAAKLWGMLADTARGQGPAAARPGDGALARGDRAPQPRAAPQRHKQVQRSNDVDLR